MQALAEGSGRTIVVSGPPMSGKSALLQEARALAKERDARVVELRGSYRTRSVPYGALDGLNPEPDPIVPPEDAGATEEGTEEPAEFGNAPPIPMPPMAFLPDRLPRSRRSRAERARTSFLGQPIRGRSANEGDPEAYWRELLTEFRGSDAHPVVVLIEDGALFDSESREFVVALSKKARLRPLLIVCALDTTAPGYVAWEDSFLGRGDVDWVRIPDALPDAREVHRLKGIFDDLPSITQRVGGYVSLLHGSVGGRSEPGGPPRVPPARRGAPPRDRGRGREAPGREGRHSAPRLGLTRERPDPGEPAPGNASRDRERPGRAVARAHCGPPRRGRPPLPRLVPGPDGAEASPGSRRVQPPTPRLRHGRDALRGGALLRELPSPARTRGDRARTPSPALGSAVLLRTARRSGERAPGRDRLVAAGQDPGGSRRRVDRAAAPRDAGRRTSLEPSDDALGPRRAVPRCPVDRDRDPSPVARRRVRLGAERDHPRPGRFAAGRRARAGTPAGAPAGDRPPRGRSGPGGRYAGGEGGGRSVPSGGAGPVQPFPSLGARPHGGGPRSASPRGARRDPEGARAASARDPPPPATEAALSGIVPPALDRGGAARPEDPDRGGSGARPGADHHGDAAPHPPVARTHPSLAPRGPTPRAQRGSHRGSRPVGGDRGRPGRREPASTPGGNPGSARLARIRGGSDRDRHGLPATRAGRGHSPCAPGRLAGVAR